MRMWNVVFFFPTFASNHRRDLPGWEAAGESICRSCTDGQSGGSEEAGVCYDEGVLISSFFPCQEHDGKFILRDIHFPQPVSPSETSPYEGVPVPEIALIRKKTSLLFWDSHDSLTIRLLRADRSLKITANSTYCKAKQRGGWGVTRSKEKGHLFWGEIWKILSSDTNVKSEAACIGGHLADNHS